jgi:hypothetical protein
MDNQKYLSSWMEHCKDSLENNFPPLTFEEFTKLMLEVLAWEPTNPVSCPVQFLETAKTE